MWAALPAVVLLLTAGLACGRSKAGLLASMQTTCFSKLALTSRMLAPRALLRPSCPRAGVVSAKRTGILAVLLGWLAMLVDIIKVL